MDSSPTISQVGDLEMIDRFVIFAVANIFLCKNYEYCLQICRIDYSRLIHSSLFEGNLQRFKALAIMQLAVSHESSSDSVNSELLNLEQKEDTSG